MFSTIMNNIHFWKHCKLQQVNGSNKPSIKTQFDSQTYNNKSLQDFVTVLLGYSS